jgi:DNA-binding MarR family transcriptional regulator
MTLQVYLEAISLIEHVHSDYHSLIKEELGCLGLADISSAQAAVLFQIGDGKGSINEVRNRTNYLGPDINWIIKKLIDNSYLLRERSQYDHRIVNVWLSDKGHALYDHLTNMHHRYITLFSERESASDLDRTLCTLRHIEQLCIDLELDG